VTTTPTMPTIYSSQPQVGRLIEAVEQPRVFEYAAPSRTQVVEYMAPSTSVVTPVANEYELINARSQIATLQAQMASVLQELAICKARLDKLDPPESPLRHAVRLVEERGNVRVNHSTGHVTLIRQLAFQPRTTKDEPTAVFRDPERADMICRDLAELSRIFSCPMTIEGHTKGGEGEFWQSLANRRAAIVAEKMVEFGADPYQLETRGLPGHLGHNVIKTEVYMDISNIQDERAPVLEVDVINQNGVVERDLVQAGRVVERDRIFAANVVTGQAVVERDMVVGRGGNQAVEREFVSTPLTGYTSQPIASPPSYLRPLQL